MTDSRPDFVHVAEQVSVERRADAVVAAFARQPTGWLRPFLLLGWNEGEMVLRQRHEIDVGNGTVRHGFEIGEPTPAPGGGVAFHLRWAALGASPLFSRMDAELIVNPLGDISVLSMFATCRASSRPNGWGTALRPQERVVRSMLGHLRAALSSGDLT